jgi:hypothetical protein
MLLCSIDALLCKRMRRGGFGIGKCEIFIGAAKSAW